MTNLYFWKIVNPSISSNKSIVASVSSPVLPQACRKYAPEISCLRMCHCSLSSWKPANKMEHLTFCVLTHQQKCQWGCKFCPWTPYIPYNLFANKDSIPQEWESAPSFPDFVHIGNRATIIKYLTLCFPAQNVFCFNS